MTATAFLAVLALFAPTADLSGTLECDRLVAVGDWPAARAACAGQPGDPNALASAADALKPPYGGKPWKARAAKGLAAAEGARALAPDRIIEEAFAHHAARLVRASLPLEDTPAGARLPLAGIPIPGPTLPKVDYAPLVASSARIAATRERLRDTRVKVQEGGPESLRRAVAAMERELTLLLQSHLATLEDAIQKDRELPPTYWLHLAGAYFEVDAHHADMAQRRARGTSVLKKLRERFRSDGAAGVAALWQAGFAVAAGDRKRVRALLDEAGPFDPDLSAWLEALLHWHAGRDAKARASVGRVGKKVSLLLRVHADALAAELELDPGKAAAGWLKVAHTAPDARIRRRASHRASVSWAEAVVAGTDAARVPPEHKRDAITQLLSRGQLGAAQAVYRALAAESPGDADLPARALQLVDVLRAAQADTDADTLLVWAGRTFTADGKPWRRENAAAYDGFVKTLGARIDARIAPYAAAGVPLADETRRALSGMVDLRTSVVPAPWAERLALVRTLGALGYATRAGVLLKRMRKEATGDQGIEAGRALVDLTVARARFAGVAGAPTGRFLHGAPAKPPMPVEVRAVVDAQTALLAALRPETEERDALLVDRATVRVEFGDAAAVLEDLRDVAGRRLSSKLGLRAIYQLVKSQPQRRAEYDALKFARRKAGHAEREAALLTTFKAVYTHAPKGDPATNLFRQRLFINAAKAYDGVDQPWAKVAAAVSFTLAHHARTAADTWRRFVKAYPKSPLAADARLHLANLLENDGHPVEAADQLEALAAEHPESGPGPLRRAIELRRYDRAALQRTLAAFVKAWPDHADAPSLRARLDALEAGVTAPAQRPGRPSAPIAPCHDPQCAQTPFWPIAQPKPAQ